MSGNQKNILTKKTPKKSKHGKKNWRKNIDISDLEKKNLQKDQELIIEKDVQFLKNEDLFTIDMQPVGGKFLNKKTDREGKAKVVKLSETERRKIQKIASELKKEKSSVNNNQKKVEASKGLWDDDTIENKIKPSRSITQPTITFPKIPIPHPGQSYNPSKQDIKCLLTKIVDLNPKRPTILQRVEQEVKETELIHFPSDSEEEDLPITDFKVSNNPAVDDFTQRKTKSEKKKNIQKKLNKVKEREMRLRKENRIKLAHDKSLKRVEKERKQQLLLEKNKKKEESKKVFEKQELLKKGFIEDAEELKDFHIKKDGIPLRKLKSKSNIISDRFENILKRNVVGEYTNKYTNKKNRKLNKYNHRDVNGDYEFFLEGEDKKLQIFE